MTTYSSIITSAYREGNLIPVGKSPSTNEQNDALLLLAQMIFNTYGFEMGEELSDWIVPAPQRTAAVQANYPQLPYPAGADSDLLGSPVNIDPSLNIFTLPPANSRIIWGRVTGTVYFPEQPNDGARMALVQASGAGDGGAAGQVLTLDGNGRTITGANTLTFTAPIAPLTETQWLYRADLGDWTAVNKIPLIGDTIPFPIEFDDLWSTRLAKRLAPRYGKVLSAETIDALKEITAKFKARYRQAAVTTYKSNDIPRGLESYIAGRWFF